MSSSFSFPATFRFHSGCLHSNRCHDLVLPASEMSVFLLFLLLSCGLTDKSLLQKGQHNNPFLEHSFISLLLLLLFICLLVRMLI